MGRVFQERFSWLQKLSTEVMGDFKRMFKKSFMRVNGVSGEIQRSFGGVSRRFGRISWGFKRIQDGFSTISGVSKELLGFYGVHAVSGGFQSISGKFQEALSGSDSKSLRGFPGDS